MPVIVTLGKRRQEGLSELGEIAQQFRALTAEDPGSFIPKPMLAHNCLQHQSVPGDPMPSSDFHRLLFTCGTYVHLDINTHKIMSRFIYIYICMQ